MNNNLFGLTDREILVLTYSLKGISNHDMAQKLFISNSAVKAHLHHLLLKTNTKNKLELATKIFCLFLNVEIDKIDYLVEQFIRQQNIPDDICDVSV